MTDSNLAAVLYKKGDLRVEEHPITEPGPGQVQISMSLVGVCGSDIHLWEDGCIGDFSSITSPTVVGHEGVGVVRKLGDGVTNLKVGDRVAIEPINPCSRCHFCKTGRYNLCQSKAFCCLPPTHGLVKRLHVHDAEFCFKLPDNVSIEEGALLEPLVVALHGCSLAGVKVGDNALVCGAGPIGLSTLLVLKSSGISKVCILDLEEHRLAAARKLGADYTLKVTSEGAKELAHKIVDTMGEKPDITIECAGACAQTAIYATKPGGCVTLIGLSNTNPTLPVVDTVLSEIKVRGSCIYANHHPTAIEMMASGKVNMKPLITHKFKLEDTAKAYETARDRVGIKVMIDCSRQ